MRHRKSRYQLNRFTSWRKATLVSLAKNLLIHQSIRTTRTKAQASKPLVEELVSLAKENTLSAKRDAYAILNDHKLVKILFNDIGPRFNNRVGGYTRIINLNNRRGDNAQLVIWELTEIKEKPKRKPKKEKEIKPEERPEAPEVKEVKPKEVKPTEEEKKKAGIAVKEKPPIKQKPAKKFFGGLRKIFKKERDSL